jgi:ferredoxin
VSSVSIFRVRMKVVIDPERCAGHGRCYVVSPSVFTDDDAGYGQVLGDGVIGDGVIGEARRIDAERAIGACPEHAISIT